MIRRAGIIQRFDQRPSVTSFWTSRFFALSIIRHSLVHLTADFTEMPLTHWSRDRRTLHLSFHVHDHCGVVLEVDEDVLHGHDGKVLVARVVRTIHDAQTDAHLEFGFVLVLVLDLVLSESESWILVTSLDRNLLVLACSWLCSCHSFPRAHPCGWVCPFVSFARDHSPAAGPLFSPARGSCWCCCGLLFVLVCPDLCPLPGVAACERRTHTTCAM